MKVKIIAALIVMIIAFAPIASHAQGLNGENEFSVTGAWFDVSGGGASLKLAGIGGSYGKFVSPNFELSLPLVFANTSEDGLNLNLYALEPEVTYYFASKNQTSPVVPYLGAGATWVDLSGNDGYGSHTSTKPTYFAGVKWFLGKTPATSDKALWFEYRHWEFDFSDTVGGSADVHADGVWAGMSFFVK